MKKALLFLSLILLANGQSAVAKKLTVTNFRLGMENESAQPVVANPSLKQHQWCNSSEDCGPIYSGDCPYVSNAHGLTCRTWDR